MSDANPYDPDRLSERAMRFCEEYCLDFSKVKAEIRSGFAPGSGPSLLDPRIIKQIEENKLRHSARINISVSWVLDKLRAAADSSGLDYFTIEESASGNQYLKLDLKNLTPAQRKSIKKIKHTKYGVEIEPVDSIAAAVKLGQYLGMFKGDEQPSSTSSVPDRFDIHYHEPEPDKPVDR